LQLLYTDVVPEESLPFHQDVVFVEVDRLYRKSQETGKKGREIKIASVHQGWKMNGKRASLKEKRHFSHKGQLPFWEEFEQYLMDTCEYGPIRHHVVINGDGRNWITSCREYMRNKPTLVIDRCHVAREVQR